MINLINEICGFDDTSMGLVVWNYSKSTGRMMKILKSICNRNCNIYSKYLYFNGKMPYKNTYNYVIKIIIDEIINLGFMMDNEDLLINI